MEPTVSIKKRLRKMINDMIPSGGTDNDVTFSDAELDDILRESENVYYAAYECWTIKAGMLQGDIESYSAGNEKYDLTSLKDKFEHALRMAQKYKEQADEMENTQTSVFLKFKSPDVI
jgi:hypothetical protein